MMCLAATAQETDTIRRAIRERCRANSLAPHQTETCLNAALRAFHNHASIAMSVAIGQKVAEQIRNDMMEKI